MIKKKNVFMVRENMYENYLFPHVKHQLSLPSILISSHNTHIKGKRWWRTEDKNFKKKNATAKELIGNMRHL